MRESPSSITRRPLPPFPPLFNGQLGLWGAQVGAPAPPAPPATRMTVVPATKICPGVKTGGGVVNHVMNEIDVQCLPDDLPEFIVVNLEQLELGHSMRLNEVPLPAGVEAISRLKKENPAIVSVQVPKAIVIEEEVAAPVTEIIGEVPAEGEEAAAEGKGEEKGEKKEAAADKKEAGKKEAAKKE